MTKPRIHTPAEIAEAARRRREGVPAAAPAPVAPVAAPVVDTLEGRIAARLREAVEHQLHGGFTVPGARSGLAVLEQGASEPVIVLSVEDVARIAAQVAEG